MKKKFSKKEYLKIYSYMLKIRRFEEREAALIEHLGLNILEPYNLVNNRCGTSPKLLIIINLV